ISQSLAKIAEQEKVKISSDAIDAIARAADGGMRDAESLLDQMIAFRASESEEISEADIVSVFGLAAKDEITTVIKALLQNDAQTLVSSVNSVAVKGKNIEKLYEDILYTLRCMQIAKIAGKNAGRILEEDEDSAEEFIKLGQDHSLDTIQRLIETMSSAARTLHDAINKHIFIEALLLRASRFAHATKIEDLIKKINELEGNLDGAPTEPKKKVLTPQ
nr:hypothetical protein [Victivallales bacterium]